MPEVFIMSLLLFIISFLLVSVSAYFITAVLRENKPAKFVVYFILTLVSLVIVQFEVLSLIKQINIPGVLISNLIVFSGTLWFWNIQNRPVLKVLGFENFKNKLVIAFKKDKILFILTVALLFCLLASLFLVFFSVSNNLDCMVYHLPRIRMWIQNMSMEHFSTPAVRQLMFPINSEILLMWPMVFIKRDFFAQFTSYLAGMGVLFVAFNSLRSIGLSFRRSLWTVLILTSIPAFILELYSTQTNVIVAFFLFASLYLFIIGVKEDDKKAVVFSAIAFAIVLGIKTTALFFIPMFFIFFGLIVFKENKLQKLAHFFVLFTGSFVLAFFLLSSYNFILNYMQFGNFIGANHFIDSFRLEPDLKSYIANLIRYSLFFIDFTGIEAVKVFNETFVGLKNFLLSLFSIDPSRGWVINDIETLNVRVQENDSKFGLLGLFVFLPLVFFHSFRALFSRNKKKFYVASAGLLMPGFLILLACTSKFVYFNNRYLLTAFILSSPIFALTYSRKINLCKVFIAIVVVFNFFVIPMNTVSKPFFYIADSLFKKDIISLRRDLRLRNDADFVKSHYRSVIDYLGKEAPDNSKIGLVAGCESLYYYFFEENPTWEIHPIRYEDLYRKKNYNDYDYLIFLDNEQKEHILDKNSVEINYQVKDGELRYRITSPYEPVTLYQNRQHKVVIEEKPTFRVNVYNFADIPGNFKMTEEFKIRLVEQATGRFTMFHFRVFKKVSDRVKPSFFHKKYGIPLPE